MKEVQIQFYRNRNRSSVSFEIFCAASHILVSYNIIGLLTKKIFFSEKLDALREEASGRGEKHLSRKNNFLSIICAGALGLRAAVKMLLFTVKSEVNSKIATYFPILFI